MLNINRHLDDRERVGAPIRVGLVGAGQMGMAFAAQVGRMRGMRLLAVCDLDPARAADALVAAGWARDRIVDLDAGPSPDGERPGVTVAAERLLERPLDAVVEATGDPEAGARVADAAIAAGLHVVMLNAEADATVGPWLAYQAAQRGVVYTGSAGDEPGATKELYDFCDALGFEVLVAGKGKNNPLDPFATPQSVRAEAVRRGMNPKMLASFVDGTKTMVEMTCLANATGLVPDVPGMHGVEADLDTVVDRLCLVSEGGVLNRYGVVEYVRGLAPGVFVIFRAQHPISLETLRYVRLGQGPNFVLYRPYHLTSVETPLSVARAAIYGEPTIAPLGAPVAETVAVAKRDLRPGDRLDGLGGTTVYGLCIEAERARRDQLLPVGLALPGTRVARPVRKGEMLTYGDVEWPSEEPVVLTLRRRQDEHFAAMGPDAHRVPSRTSPPEE